MSATQLLAGGYDVIVASYEFAERGFKDISVYYKRMQEHLNKRESGNTSTIPKRPTTASFSNICRELELPFKRVVLDEVQKVNKRHGRRHVAIKNLHAKGFIMLSGTLPHNKWDDMSGYVDFLKDHPFTTHAEFIRTFTTSDYTGFNSSPDAPKLRLLQRFLQAVLIARPTSILKLETCIQKAVRYDADADEIKEVQEYTRKYKEVSAINAADGQQAQMGKADFAAGGALGMAIYAQMRSLHPLLISEKDQARLMKGVSMDMDYEEGKSDDEYKPDIPIEDDTDAASRADWLKEIKETPDLLIGSSRTQCFLRLFKWLRQEYPSRKIVIFSNFLKYLDIIDEVLQQGMAITPLRYDGSVSVSQRPDIEERFKTCAPEIPLLITGGAGGVGLILTAGSIVVQLETWWNRSTELQAVGRCHRQLQTESVLYLRIEAKDGMIDQEIQKVQKRKTVFNEELMRPLIRLHTAGPAHIPLLSFPGLAPLRWEEFRPCNPDTFFHFGGNQIQPSE
ncbi:hypothetical protein VE02_06279 [Pseudogymnoascus sp. 03VT05]|nr:hypothetical protein VE02_06279 [Pseudogymnoascus sp. 03VT05]